MTITTVSKTALQLPQELQTAQDAMALPEVQEMLQKLAKYNLGIFMPHMHETGVGFLPPKDGVLQVESELKVSFQPVEQVKSSIEPYVTVGWVWKNGPRAWSCCVLRPHDTMHYTVGKFVGDPPK